MWCGGCVWPASLLRFGEFRSRGVNARSQVNEEQKLSLRAGGAFDDEGHFSLAIFLAEHAHRLCAVSRQRLLEIRSNLDERLRNADSVIG